MFDFDAGKLLIVGVIALVFIPPKDLPRVLRQVGQFVGKMRRLAADFQGQFMDAMREADMADLRKEAQKLADAARIDTGLGHVGSDISRHIAAPSSSPDRVMAPLPAVEPSHLSVSPPDAAMASLGAPSAAASSHEATEQAAQAALDHHSDPTRGFHDPNAELARLTQPREATTSLADSHARAPDVASGHDA